MKKLILLIFLAGFYRPAICQNTGYLGKRVILKTDLINGKRAGFQNIDMEVAVSRNMAVTASYRRYSYAGTSKPVEPENNSFIYFNQYFEDVAAYIRIPYSEHKHIYPGKTTGNYYAVGLKYYLNKILPAPLGLYAGVDLGFGSAILNYDYHTIYKPEYTNLNLPDISEGRKNIISETRVIYISFPAVGYQHIFAGRLVADARFSIDTFINNLPQKFINEYPYPYFSANIGSGKAGNVTTGIAVYGKIGLLLF